MNKIFILLVCFTLLFPVIHREINAESYPVFTDNRLFKKVDAAIKGYDTVAYFTESKPVEGKEEITTKYQNVTWRFSSQENKALFLKNPEKYVPQYGGYCAYAMSRGDFVKIDPKAWKVLDGKLYLNYTPKIQKKWDKDRSDYIYAADREWKKSLEM